MTPSIFRTVVLERLRLPLSVTEATCVCGRHLDSLGQHRAACPHSGKLRTRAVGPERTVARICREAGALVRCSVEVRDMNVTVPATDEREVEVVASGHAAADTGFKGREVWVWGGSNSLPKPQTSLRFGGRGS